MPKYTYKPIYESHIELYKENAGEDAHHPDLPSDLNATLIVVAENDEECLSIRNVISHSPSWELISVEE